MQILAQLGIEHQTFDHPPVFTCEESQQLCPPMPGLKNKNLFLKDEKGKKYFLVSLTQDKQLNLKDLGQKIGVKGLSFASERRLQEVLGVAPGSVGILALINDTQKLTTVYIDEDLLEAEWFQSHPLVNTSTTCFKMNGFNKFFKHTGHHFQEIKL
jgi:Ala-tRNA(Pro) deacylase